MPRTRFRRKKFRRSRGRRMTASRVKAIVKGVAEKKSFDTSYLGDDAVAGASHIVPLMMMAEGVGGSGRIGDTIEPKSIQIRCGITTDDSPAGDTVVRMMIVREDNAEGATPVVTEVLDTDDIVSLRNFQQGGQFRIVMDKTIRLVKPGLQTIKQFMIFKKYIKLPKNERVQYIGSTAAVTSLGKHQYWVLFVVDQAAGNQPTWRFESRVVYTDI